MNITALLYNAVRYFRGPQPEDSNGAAGLAPYMGITSTSLSHKVSPTHTAHCSPEEIVAICKLTGDHAAVRAMAKQLGYYLVPVPQQDADLDPEYIGRVTACAKEFGEFLAEATTSYADKHVSDSEMVKITKEFAESMAAQSHLFSILQAKHEGGKPGHITLPVRQMRDEPAPQAAKASEGPSAGAPVPREIERSTIKETPDGTRLEIRQYFGAPA